MCVRAIGNTQSSDSLRKHARTVVISSEESALLRRSHKALTRVLFMVALLNGDAVCANDGSGVQNGNSEDKSIPPLTVEWVDSHLWHLADDSRNREVLDLATRVLKTEPDQRDDWSSATESRIRRALDVLVPKQKSTWQDVVCTRAGCIAAVVLVTRSLGKSPPEFAASLWALVEPSGRVKYHTMEDVSPQHATEVFFLIRL